MASEVEAVEQSVVDDDKLWGFLVGLRSADR